MPYVWENVGMRVKGTYTHVLRMVYKPDPPPPPIKYNGTWLENAGWGGIVVGFGTALLVHEVTGLDRGAKVCGVIAGIVTAGVVGYLRLGLPLVVEGK